MPRSLLLLPLLPLLAAASARAEEPELPCPLPSERELGLLTRRALRAAEPALAPALRAPAVLPFVRAQLRGDRRGFVALLLVSFDLPRALFDRRAIAGSERTALAQRAAIAERVARLAAARARLECPPLRSLTVEEAARRELRRRAAIAELRALTGEVGP
jgi:hypothetical protein